MYKWIKVQCSSEQEYNVKSINVLCMREKPGGGYAARLFLLTLNKRTVSISALTREQSECPLNKFTLCSWGLTLLTVCA